MIVLVGASLNTIKIVVLCSLFLVSSSPIELSFARYAYEHLMSYEFFYVHAIEISILFNQLVMLGFSLVGLYIFKTQLTQNKFVKENVLSWRFLFLIPLFLLFSILVYYVITHIYEFFIDNYKNIVLSKSKPLFDNDEYGIEWSSVLTGFLIHCLVVPATQELFFRGVIFKCSRITSNYYLSAILSSFAFITVHEEFVFTFFLSMFICYIYERFGFYGAYIAHAAYNIFILIMHVIYFLIYDVHLVLALNNQDNQAYILSVVIILIFSIAIIRNRSKESRQLSE